MAGLAAPQFKDANKAREYLEKLRWSNGPICPHCGGVEKIYQLKGKAGRPGLYKCGDCRKQFTVTVGTLFEGSKISLDKWLQAVYLMCASKKGISSHQLHRMLGITYKSAWFMTHRIREAMKDPIFSKMGGGGGVVEADETFWGNKKPKGQKKGRGYHHKEKVFSLVERGGKVRSFHVPRVNADTLKPISGAHDLTKTIANRIDAHLAEQEECYTTVDGMLEKANVHAGANVFTIYPNVGPDKIICHLNQNLVEKAISALRHRVAVSGIARYRKYSPYPYQIGVEEIEIFGREDELPSFDDLKGIAPDATGETSSEEFIRNIRDGWH